MAISVDIISKSPKKNCSFVLGNTPTVFWRPETLWLEFAIKYLIREREREREIGEHEQVAWRVE